MLFILRPPPSEIRIQKKLKRSNSPNLKSGIVDTLNANVFTNYAYAHNRACDLVDEDHLLIKSAQHSVLGEASHILKRAALSDPITPKVVAIKLTDLVNRLEAHFKLTLGQYVKQHTLLLARKTLPKPTTPVLGVRYV